ncbi:hypothetical protein ASF83_10430 [Plantibacter sp. Leaf171]|jgi:hypothetical protein|nr:hypothetical protein BWO91_02980 [Plantibacter flavus]KQM16264.1 hypothetical protein ASE44_10445 [Plantibacter sp. Leaf1]KQQ52366.1 hypothetical protein ASF68_08480 [Plantibacter sp. Leaf314]KQR59397.1 hypothetical protein ASF83_10430 [Plantibacter sp. Leaf171]
MLVFTELDEFLRGMEYPCRPSDLTREARRDLLPTHLVEALRSLPERSYTSRWDVLHRTSIAEALPIGV